MRYFALLDDLFTFNFLLTEDSLGKMSSDMLNSKRIVSCHNPIIPDRQDTLDSDARIDRNNAIYFDVIRRARNESSGSFEDKTKVIDFIKSKSESDNDTLICNTASGAFLVEYCDFKPSEPSESANMGGTPFMIGTIGKLRLFVDPFMQWTDTRIFIWNKSKILVSGYFDDVKTLTEPSGNNVARTDMVVYSHEVSPIENYLIKIPTEELI